MKAAIYKNRYLLLLIAVVLCMFAFPLFAQAPVPIVPTPIPVAPVPTSPNTVLAGQILVIAGMISALLQGVKKLIPAVNGKIAVALNIALSIAGAYAVAPAGSVLTIQFLCSVIGNSLGSMGIYSLVKKSQAETNPGDGTVKLNKMAQVGDK